MDDRLIQALLMLGVTAGMLFVLFVLPVVVGAWLVLAAIRLLKRK